MQYEIRRMSETNRRINDTLPPTGRVNEGNFDLVLTVKFSMVTFKFLR